MMNTLAVVANSLMLLICLVLLWVQIWRFCRRTSSALAAIQSQLIQVCLSRFLLQQPAAHRMLLQQGNNESSKGYGTFEKGPSTVVDAAGPSTSSYARSAPIVIQSPAPSICGRSPILSHTPPSPIIVQPAYQCGTLPSSSSHVQQPIVINDPPRGRTLSRSPSRIIVRVLRSRSSSRSCSSPLPIRSSSSVKACTLCRTDHLLRSPTQPPIIPRAESPVSVYCDRSPSPSPVRAVPNSVSATSLPRPESRSLSVSPIHNTCIVSPTSLPPLQACPTQSPSGACLTYAPGTDGYSPAAQRRRQLHQLHRMLLPATDASSLASNTGNVYGFSSGANIADGEPTISGRCATGLVNLWTAPLAFPPRPVPSTTMIPAVNASTSTNTTYPQPLAWPISAPYTPVFAPEVPFSVRSGPYAVPELSYDRAWLCATPTVIPPTALPSTLVSRFSDDSDEDVDEEDVNAASGKHINKQ
jgi:hypothetical protein